MFVVLLLMAIFVLFPVLMLALRNSIPLNAAQRYFTWSVPFFLLHNLFYAMGYSLQGDLPDYILFLLEYMSVTLLINICKRWKNNLYTRILSWTGIIAGILVIFASPLLFLILIMFNYRPDKQFTFHSAGKSYTTRLHTEGFAPLMSTRFTFTTYRCYKYLPFENQVDFTSFLDSEAGISPGDGTRIYIDEEKTPRSLVFRWTDGQEMVKPIR